MSMTVMMILLQGRSGEAVTVRLRGRVDGWLEGEGAIVEVKNRCVGAPARYFTVKLLHLVACAT
jgi:hypothetical protein